MSGDVLAVSALPAVGPDGAPFALVQLARVGSDGGLELAPGLTACPLEIEGEVCGQSIEDAVYRLLDEMNGKGDADADEDRHE